MNFKLLTWNCLCNKYSNIESFPKSKEENLKFNNRFKKIVNYINENKPDIITLQEIDEKQEFENEFKNYYIIFFPKKESFYGNLIMIKSELIKNYSYHFFNDDIKGFIHIIFQINNLEFNIITTHLKAKKEFFKKREIELKQIETYIKDKNIKNIIISGDFNCDYKIENYINIFIDNLNLKMTNKGFTTFKYQKDYNKKIEKIDYILYNSDNISYFESNKEYTEDEIGKNGLPNNLYPSDHLPILTKFFLK